MIAKTQNECIHPTLPTVLFAMLTTLWAKRVMLALGFIYNHNPRS